MAKSSRARHAPQAPSRSRGSGGRPLRWWKFALFLPLAAACVVRGWPSIEQLTSLLLRGADAIADPTVLLAGAAVATFGITAIGRLIADAGWDLRLGRTGAAAILAAAFVPVPPPARPDAESALLRCAARVVRRLQEGMRAELPVGCHHSLYRDRLLRRLPVQLVEVEHPGPIRSPPPGTRAGTIVLAREGAAGWVTAFGPGADGAEPLRNGSSIWIGAFTTGGWE